MAQSQDDVRAAYDLACEVYAQKFTRELDYKPRDRELLDRFASFVGPGNPVLDLGCGPGHTTAHLNSLGVRATGLDLSPGMIAQAKNLFPETEFVVGDMLELQFPDSSMAGVLAFYSIVHFSPSQLPRVFGSMHRVLKDGGVVLLSFHVGTEVYHNTNFLETGTPLDFTCFDVVTVESALAAVGFGRIETIVREPYEPEYPSQRCYMLAFRA